MFPHKHGIVTHKYKKVEVELIGSTPSLTCMCCGVEVEVFNSTPGKVEVRRFGIRIQKNPKLFRSRNGSVVSVPVEKDHGIIKLKAGRVCHSPDCLSRLVVTLFDPCDG